jgi:hypothetical protein
MIINNTTRPLSIICLLYFAKAICPDRFADTGPDAVRREYSHEFGFGDEPGVEWFYPPSGPVNATAATKATAGSPHQVGYVAPPGVRAEPS